MSDSAAELLFESEGLYENLTAEEYDDLLNGEHQYNFFAIIYMAIMPVSCVVGLTGNCLVYILIRSNQIFRRLPSSPYLLALSICSTMFLISLLSFWTEEVSILI
jgi:H+/Cl- antiporter ClcA